MSHPPAFWLEGHSTMYDWDSGQPLSLDYTGEFMYYHEGNGTGCRMRRWREDDEWAYAVVQPTKEQ